MTFGTVHKATTYAMVATAMLAMVGGGGVSPIFTLIGVIGLAASWFWEAPRVNLDRWAPWWTAASVLVMAYALLMGIATGDYLGTGAEFLLWLTLAKAFTRRSMRDWQQLHLLALLMLIAGSVLNVDLLYGVAFLLFVVTATWARIVFQLRREAEENVLLRHRPGTTDASDPAPLARMLASRRVVTGRLLAGTALASLGIFVASAAFFLAMPRVGAGFFLKGRTGLSMAGFSDGVQLGGHGVIKDDKTIVMRVRMPSGYDRKTAPPIHWRGVAFDHYNAGSWSRTAASPVSTYTVDEPARGRERRLIAQPGRRDWGDDVETVIAGATRQDVWLEPMETDVLFGASMPRVYDLPVPARRGATRLERNDEVRQEHGSTIHYTVWSDLTPPDAAELRAAAGPIPLGYQAFLEIPDDITARTIALARKITADAQTPYDRAMALLTWLRGELRYTLEQADPGDLDPIDFFLFERRAGHCEYFASAFVVMARAVGLPTREVAGFLGGEWNEYDNYVAVRAGDAHAWAEVYFPGSGWVTFDATPGADADAARVDTGIRAKLRRFLDTLRFQWTRWVIDYDLRKQLSMFKGLGSSLKDAAKAVRGAFIDAKNAARDNLALSLGVGLAIAALVAWRVRRRWQRGPRGPGALPPRARGPIARAYALTRRDLAAAGIGRDAALTPRELVRQRTVQLGAEAEPLRELTELFYAVEYGGRPGDGSRADALRQQIRAALKKPAR